MCSVREGHLNELRRLRAQTFISLLSARLDAARTWETRAPVGTSSRLLRDFEILNTRFRDGLMRHKSVTSLRRPARHLVDASTSLARRAVASFTGDRGPLRGFVATAAQAARESGGHHLLVESAAAPSDPATFVVTLPGGRSLFDYGVIATADRRLIGDVSPQLGASPREHLALKAWRLPAPERVTGCVAVLTSTAHQRYYHWMFDILPRLAILRRSGIPFDLLLANLRTSYQVETLAALGVNETADPGFPSGGSRPGGRARRTIVTRSNRLAVTASDETSTLAVPVHTSAASYTVALRHPPVRPDAADPERR